MDVRIRKPEWLRVKPFHGEKLENLTRLLRERGLNTVCQEANCPNRGECFAEGTATFLLMGPICTRACRFCDIATGKPAPLDANEPARVAEAAALMGLRHVVVTSVDRDDLPDGGAAHFAATVAELRKALPGCSVELLTPDFRNAPAAIPIIIECRPEIFNHNMETIPRLYSAVRPGAVYERSLGLLRAVHDQSSIRTKSGLMVGLGETAEELEEVFSDLHDNGVSILTVGQYLCPSRNHYPVDRYWTPAEFDDLAERARRIGIRTVVSGPLVRSSYHAANYASA